MPGPTPVWNGTFMIEVEPAEAGSCLFNCECEDTNDSKTLAEYRTDLTTALAFKAQLPQQTGVTLLALRTFLVQRLGFAAISSNLPPGTEALMNNFINDAQRLVWQQYAFDAYAAAVPTEMVDDDDTCELDAEAIRLFALSLGKAYYGKEDAKLATQLAGKYLEDLSLRGPPTLAAMLTKYLQDAQKFLYMKYPALRTRRYFRWSMAEGVRYYGMRDNDECSGDDCVFNMEPYKNIEGAWVEDVNGTWLPLTEGIPGTFYTTVTQNGIPLRFEIRSCVEVFPAPNSDDYKLWLKGHFGLQAFTADADQCTIDGHMVYLWALADAKLKFRPAEAAQARSDAREYLGTLVAGTHGARRYVPGTTAMPPAVMPVLLPLPGA